MFFSIVIPTYNREATILRAINSILSQTFTDFEIIVVDDGSIDSTGNLIHSLKEDRIKYYKTENNGVAHARNYGIIRAKGEYIGFLDSDDLFENDHLKNAHELIQSEKFPEAIHLNFLWGPEDRKKVNKNKLPDQLPEDLFNACSLHVDCIFLKNNIAQQHLFNESKELMFVEDWDFFIKLAVRYSIKLSDTISAYLVDHADRNMRKFNEAVWVQKRDALLKSLHSDNIIASKYPGKLKAVASHMNSLIAVNLASRKNKMKALSYYLLSLKQNRRELFTRRSAAIIKHLLISWY